MKSAASQWACQHHASRSAHVESQLTVGQNSFSFLDLPAELRNVIYELCLLEPNRITITAELKQPALLMTCRQIRSETKLMWFWRNTYQYTVVDCDSRLVYAFHTLYGGPLPNKVRVNIYATGQNNWTALMEWCKFIFAHRRHCFRRPTLTQGREVIRAATVLTSQSGAATWKDCKRDLQLLRLLAISADRAWSKNYRRIKTSQGGYAWIRMLTPSKSTIIPSTT